MTGAGRRAIQQDRLVAVLQQEPIAPAFLLTLDTHNAHWSCAGFRRRWKPARATSCG